MTSIAPAGYRDLPALMTLMTCDEKHCASATSTLDALWVLYDQVLAVDPAHPDAPDRDRFLLSKGHGPMAYYAVLAAKGFLSRDQLRSFGRFDSPLGYHPDRTLVPGAEISSGSLGHGLGLAVGTALGLRVTGYRQARVVVLLGDAELEEGSNLEAIQYAGRQRLDQLMAIVIDNSSASLGWPGGIGQRFVAEGWSAIDVAGRDHQALARAYAAGRPGRPHAVIAHVERKDS
ncbi:MAG: transketolase [Jatrophihabitans sp.]